MNEFEFLKKLKQHFKFDLIGDDCAVLPLAGGPDLLVTSDMLAEGVDFRLEWTDPESVGHKSLAVSLSDIAAMGGDAEWATVSIAVPEGLWNQDFLFAFYTGFNNLAEDFGVRLAGGDVSRSLGDLVIDCTVIGSCPTGEAVMRSGARPGDLVFVTGLLGGAAAGLRLLESQHVDTGPNGWHEDSPVGRQLKPIPQLTLGKLLREQKLVTSMIDVSDGLSSDLHHICAAANVGAVIDADLVPVDPAVGSIGPELLRPFESPLDAALNGGEDFELLFTAPAEAATQIGSLGCIAIGEIVEVPSVFEMSRKGTREPLKIAGYDHFRQES